MRIRVVAFATVAETLGAASLDLEIPDGSRVLDLKRILEERAAGIAGLWPRLAVAVDGAIATPRSKIREGSEVALLPPVSGGAEGRVQLVDGPIDLEAVEHATRVSGKGALLMFVGRVRDRHRGRPVERLTYDAYRTMAEAALERIVTDLESARPGVELRIVHRLGEVAAGEASVVIAVVSPHRDEAYETSRRALERLKREVPIWKREHYTDGEAVWREEEPLRLAKHRGAGSADGT